MKKVLRFPEFNAKVIIRQEDQPQSPRTSWDNAGVMVCFHSRYSLGDKHSYSSNDYNGWDEMERAISRKENVAVILPLYLYDHSGQTISTKPFSCSWDSGQVGFIYMTKQQAIAEFGKKICTAKVRENALNLLQGEVETYDQYLQGYIYEFEVKTIDTKDSIDSCSGFYGDEVDNGIFDYVGIEGLTIERYTEVFNQANFK